MMPLGTTRNKTARALLAGTLLIAGLALGGCGFFDSGGSSSTNGATVSTAGNGSGQSTSTVQPSTTLQPVTTVQPTTTAPPASLPSTSTTSSASSGKPAKNYTKLPTKDKVVALTFDAAYDPAPLKDILAALKAADVQATFFLTGGFVRDFPKWTQEIIAGGYPIGNHSYSHPDFTTISAKAKRDQIEKTAAALVKLGAADPTPLFRAPYGALNKQVLSVLGSEGYVSVFWTIDTLDWKPERTTAQIKATVLGKLQPGAIVLMHVGSKQEAQVLPEIIAEIKARGYRFVNLREALPEAAG